MNKMFDIISFEELYDRVELDASNNKIKTAAQALLTAIKDWPTTNLSQPKELLLTLTTEIGAPLTHKKIETYSKTLNINNSAWKMEVTCSLLEMFEYDNTKTFDEIITDISLHYKQDKT